MDQAALEVATQLGLATGLPGLAGCWICSGGWCPPGCVDENGPISMAQQWGLKAVSAKVWEEHEGAKKVRKRGA